MDDNLIASLPRNWQGLDIVTLSLKNNPIMNADHLIHELPCAVYLNLQKCLLTVMPANLSSALRLTALDVSDNSIEAITIIPQNLIYLSLDNNPLGFLSNSIQHMKRLNTLSARWCGLKELPSFLCKQNRLETLFVSHNCLTHLPHTLNNTILSTVDISYNPLHTLDSLCVPKRLRILRADACCLHIFPKEVLYSHKLTELRLEWNGVRSLPNDMVHFNLTKLTLYGNAIKVIPNAIHGLKYLRTLYLNEMTEFPEAVLHLSTLVYFFVLGCPHVDYHIMLPSSWESMINLQKLICWYSCHFLSVGSLGKLMELAIDGSKDAIPSDVANNKFLKKLYLAPFFVASNYSPPPIKDILLKSLNIRNYKLLYFPNTFREKKRLEELRICRTNLKAFPEELSANLKKLKTLEVRLNDILALPKVWSCRRLADLNLSEVPLEAWCPILPQLPNITKLSISGCRLFSFPSALQLLCKLEELNISNNHIKDLPTEWHNRFLKVLSVANNSLGSGSTLTMISQLSCVHTLNLSGNNLDKFPSAIHSLKYLRDLDISDNPVGTFPKTLQRLQSLEIFKGSACELHKFPRFLLKLLRIKNIELNGNRI